MGNIEILYYIYIYIIQYIMFICKYLFDNLDLYIYENKKLNRFFKKV